jgi:hypothetical protein
MHLFMNRCRLHALSCVTLALCAVLGRPAAAAAAGQYRAVATFGQGLLVSPSFDAADRIVVGNTTGVWVEESGNLLTKLSVGDQAPGFPAGTTIGALTMGSPVVQKGNPAIVAGIQNGPTVTYAAYVDEPGLGLRLASYTGKIIDPAAGIQVSDLGFVGHGSTRAPEPIANESGDVLMYGWLEGGPVGARSVGAWIERPGGSQIVFHGNMAMPGASSKFGDFFGSDLAFENTGRVATVHHHSEGDGLWVFDAPGLTGGRLAARTGTVRNGILVGQINYIQMANWRVVFHADYRGVFVETNGVSELLAGEGRPAPGFALGATFVSVHPEDTAMNSHGDVAFVAQVADPTLSGGYAGGIWRETRDGPVQLALNLSDYMAPYPGANVPFVSQVVMNDAGQLAFLEQKPSPALWFFDAEAGPQRVAAVGEQIALTIGGMTTTKTIEDIRVGGFLASGLRPSRYLSNSGDVVFQATFTDNSRAVIVWSSVPEPASSVLAIVSAAGAAVWRRRR